MGGGPPSAAATTIIQITVSVIDAHGTRFNSQKPYFVQGLHEHDWVTVVDRVTEMTEATLQALVPEHTGGGARRETERQKP